MKINEEEIEVIDKVLSIDPIHIDHYEVQESRRLAHHLVDHFYDNLEGGGLREENAFDAIKDCWIKNKSRFMGKAVGGLCLSRRENESFALSSKSGDFSATFHVERIRSGWCFVTFSSDSEFTISGSAVNSKTGIFFDSFKDEDHLILEPPGSEAIEIFLVQEASTSVVSNFRIKAPKEIKITRPELDEVNDG